MNGQSRLDRQLSLMSVVWFSCLEALNAQLSLKTDSMNSPAIYFVYALKF